MIMKIRDHVLCSRGTNSALWARPRGQNNASWAMQIASPTQGWVLNSCLLKRSTPSSSRHFMNPRLWMRTCLPLFWNPMPQASEQGSQALHGARVQSPSHDMVLQASVSWCLSVILIKRVETDPWCPSFTTSLKSWWSLKSACRDHWCSREASLEYMRSNLWSIGMIMQTALITFPKLHSPVPLLQPQQYRYRLSFDSWSLVFCAVSSELIWPGPLSSTLLHSHLQRCKRCCHQLTGDHSLGAHQWVVTIVTASIQEVEMSSPDTTALNCERTSDTKCDPS